MLKPKNTKYLKSHKGRNRFNSCNGNYLSFGNFGLKSISRGFLTSNQIESARKVISKYIKKEGKIWIRVFPDKPISKKPIDLRMGNGKGDIVYYVFSIKPGKIIYEINCSSKITALKVFKLASYKLPIKTILVYF